ncbi:MAG: hypothetical protein GWM98_06315 [Nitrospinaceae bacterium]|nr:hypothetical protein [Nitrospinaceae bacterium]NIR54173.1 hypothetical protein [Nitrospinaceae bacterium]NIS84591.1 hypothetical protein [Nitrospinaceae bacterium]NIT81383.1 hypothetical protein [Nitrospinaceae bacterium]NIU43670.1 hypothetical protein [Nitrospinaceae bacterium]
MLEIGITLCILLFFIFPVPGLAICLGVWTCFLTFQKIHLLRSQAPQWRPIVWLHFLSRGTNALMSVFLGLLLSLSVYLLIFNSLRLLVFNFIFCTIISMRWFDFTHSLYRRLSLKIKGPHKAPGKDSIFIMLKGMRTGTGMGIGMHATSLDSGYLTRVGNQWIFDGIIQRRVFRPETIVEMEKVSSEKIKVIPSPNPKAEEPEAWLITIREKFYPFKTRELRDQLFDELSGQPVADLTGVPGLNPSNVSAG